VPPPVSDAPFFFLDGASPFEGVIREKQPRGWTVLCAHYDKSTLLLVVKSATAEPPAHIGEKQIFEYCCLDVEKTRRELGVVFRSI
jgi:hypothetical protein